MGIVEEVEFVLRALPIASKVPWPAPPLPRGMITCRLPSHPLSIPPTPVQLARQRQCEPRGRRVASCDMQAGSAVLAPALQTCRWRAVWLGGGWVDLAAAEFVQGWDPKLQACCCCRFVLQGQGMDTQLGSLKLTPATVGVLDPITGPHLL